MFCNIDISIAACSLISLKSECETEHHEKNHNQIMEVDHGNENNNFNIPVDLHLRMTNGKPSVIFYRFTKVESLDDINNILGKNILK